MFFINKNADNESAFQEVVLPFTTYEELSASGEPRDHAKKILLNEQGCLCPFCEKRLDIGLATIEHFKPKSIYPDLQLDYFNLFVCCKTCNERKDNHLIPAYIFDPRLDFNNLIKSGNLFAWYGFGFRFYVSGLQCVLKNSSLDKNPKSEKDLKPEYWAKMIFQNVIELLKINDPLRLGEPRRKAFIALVTQIGNSSNDKLKEVLRRTLEKT